jgi:hypothetical protein
MVLNPKMEEFLELLIEIGIFYKYAWRFFAKYFFVLFSKSV